MYDSAVLKKEVRWGEFKVGCLFEIRPTKSYGLTNTDLFKTAGVTPVLTNTSTNNGMSGYIDLPPTEKGNMITFSDTTTADGIFYQPHDFIGYSHIQGMYPKKFSNFLSKKTYLYIISAFKKATVGLYNYGSKFNRENAKNTTIYLPTLPDNTPDFIYMESYIAQLEAARIAQLEAYLCATGLSDYTLTSEDENVLSQTVTWGDFFVKNLFEKQNLKFVGDYPFSTIKNGNLSTEQTKEFSLPLVNAKHGDNGIMYYGRMSDFEYEEDCIAIISNGAVATGNVYPQPQKTGILWDAYLIKPFSSVSREGLCYLATVLQKPIKQKYGYENKATWNKVKTERIKLPILSNKTPDFGYMECYIKAIQKQTIARVVEGLDLDIAVAKEIASN